MLKHIRSYAPSTLTNWWYGASEDDQVKPLNCVPEDENEVTENNPKNKTNENNPEKEAGGKETQFMDNLKIIGIDRNGISSEDDYKTGSEFNHSDSIIQFPVTSSDDEYRTCIEQHHQLDGRVRKIKLGGLRETNGKKDIDQLGRRKYTKHSSSQSTYKDTTLLSHSAPAGEIRRMLMDVRKIEHIYEHTDDSDSSHHYDTSSLRNNKATFPFNLLDSSKKHQRRRANSSSYEHEGSLILRVRPKSYGAVSHTDDERTVSFSGKRSQTSSLENRRRGSENSLSDSNYPGVSLSSDHLSVSYRNRNKDMMTEKRQSILSESSFQLSLCSLNSSWSEYTISLSSLEEGLECRESDIESTKEIVCSTLKTRPQYLVGHKVKESFIDNECYCFHCTIL